MSNAPSNTDNVIDSRDIISRIEELQAERDSLENAVEISRKKTKAKAELAAFDESDEGKELTMLTALAEECSDYAPDWQYGETLIRDTYFKTYAEELANECGMIDPKLVNTWPYTCIDWERAARELQYDYAQVDFDGVEYWVRSC